MEEPVGIRVAAQRRVRDSMQMVRRSALSIHLGSGRLVPNRQSLLACLDSIEAGRPLTLSGLSHFAPTMTRSLRRYLPAAWASRPDMNSALELPGSSRPEPEGARAIRDASRDAQVYVTVHLQGTQLEVASPATIELFERFASTYRLSMQFDSKRRCVLMGGKLERISKAFGTSLRIYSNGVDSFRARSGPLHIPEELAPITLAVLGLDERPIVMRPSISLPPAAPDRAGMWPREVAALYGVTADLDAPGECVGIVASGGGYLPTDLTTTANPTLRKVPLVVNCPVNGTNNQFGGGIVGRSRDSSRHAGCCRACSLRSHCGLFFRQQYQ